MDPFQGLLGHCVGAFPPGCQHLIEAAAVSAAVYASLTLLEQDPQASAAAAAAGPERKVACVLSHNQSGRVIGKGGATINQIRTESGANVHMGSAPVPGAEPTERVVTVSGTTVTMVAALQASRAAI